MIEVLETDPHFREKLQTANTEDIKVRAHVLPVYPDVTTRQRLIFVFCARTVV